ncbi:hypothetical protein J4E91_009302 [Alternaria rosae]|nr:hypothetical protein J4E91_009302 [Alternaria rosae]
MSTAQRYHDALLALSGNPALVAARSGLLIGMSSEELIDVITCGLRTGVTRGFLNTIATQVFEEIAATQAGGVIAPVEDKDGGEVTEDSNDVVRNDSQTPRRRAERGSRANQSRDPRKFSHYQPVQTPKARTTQSSTANQKRRGSNLARTGKKTGIVNLESEAEEEDQVNAQMFNEGEADIIVGDEPEGDANAVADTNSDTEATPDEVVPTPWKEVQESSTMLDLSLTDSEDGCSSDEDYTEDLADTELSYGVRGKRPTSESSLLRDVDVVFRIPTAQGHELKELDEFPIAFVKEMTRKFN